jgi:FtsZ-binding cell division protein ZapB
VQLATDALEELRKLASAVRQQREQQSQGPQAGKQQDPQPPADEQQPADPNRVQQLQLAVAQLGLLRNLQAELKERTAELEQERASGAIDDATLRERSEQLANEQRELTELAAALLREAARSTEGLNELDEEE